MQHHILSVAGEAIADHAVGQALAHDSISVSQRLKSFKVNDRLMLDIKLLPENITMSTKH